MSKELSQWDYYHFSRGAVVFECDEYYCPIEPLNPGHVVSFTKSPNGTVLIVVDFADGGRRALSSEELCYRS